MACDARDGSLRYRQKGTNGVHQPPWNGVLQDGGSYVTTQANGQRQPLSRHEKRLLGQTFYACLLAFYLATTLLVRSLQVSLPNAVSSDPADEGRVFVGARAKQRLAKLVAIGQRSVGSLENEVIAVDYLMRELGQLRERARPAHRLEFEVQKPNGSFFLDFIDGFTSSYRGIQNVIARLSPSDRPAAVDQRHSLLVNCHYDTAPGSPGASDDSIGCAIMLEILHVLSRRREPLPHPIIFLFNGAEENILQGSHGFITQHKWAKEVAAFVNLEACGAGGKELLFQASPSDPWLVKAYVDGATRPFGSIVAEEVFQSGLIPSDTDFRIFRDFGGIPGLDFAFAENGYVYHTKYDNMDYIPDGSIQHAGENMLGLILKILEARELSEGSSLGGTGDTDVIRAVYYDFLGIFMVTYSVSVSSIVVKLIIVISLVSMALRMKASATGGRELHRHELALQVWGRIQALLVTVCSWGLGLVACILVALTLTVTGSTMSWYKQPILVLGLYYSTMIATLMACHWVLTMLRRRHFKASTTGLKVLGESEECDDWNVLERYLDATQLLWLTLVFWLSSKNILSYYIPNLWAVFTGTVVSVLSHWTLGMGRKGNKKVLMVAILGAVFFPLLLTVYLSFNIHMGILPIMGRNGTLENPEIAVAIMSGVLAIACTSFVVPLTHVSRDGWKPIAVLSGLVVLTMLIAMSPLGFPFSATSGDVAPQRMLLFNVERKFYDRHQSMVKQDAGVWAVPLDFNGPRTIRQHIGTRRQIKKVDCNEHVYCGMPYYFPVISKLKETYFADFPGPIFNKGRTFRLLSRNVTKTNTIRLSFELTGPSHMGLIVSPWEGVSLTRWSFTSGTPYKGIKWKNRDTTFVYLSQGVDMGPWRFWIELQLPHGYPTSKPIVDIAFHTYHLQKSEHKQPAFVKFLNELPEWIHATAWTSSSDFYVF
ncbi:endoplasmic reticulum metallopeptidase 1 [Rhipicephalus sanguineus]|uniref:endoplasmic reticulum metallopeptidase 1 n=1 Tax=Rhipicephalus sanguineus TaxID=34632 RepID=UPI0018937FEC|nr:endoplasmic reticulum metallopeptidase 1 [Rhipicephalus sanguineus]